MLRLLLSRLWQTPLVLAAVLLISFAMIWAMPGDPTVRDGSKQLPEQVTKAIQAQYHLDQGPAVFLSHYVWDAAHGDFGPSIRYDTLQVSDILKKGLPVSAGLGLLALALALILGTLAAIIATLWPRGWAEWLSTGLTLIGVSWPSFVTGSVFLYLGVTLLRLPIGGWDGPLNLILPTLTLSLAPAAYIARLLRLGLAEVMAGDFIRTARAKGLTYDQALFRHALKVAYLPVLSFLGPAAAGTMTGSFIVEKLFNIPGIGQDFVTAVQNKDPFLILGVVMVSATLLVFFNLLVDIAYAWVDPRIEVQ